jgi:hypothetical protein
MPDRTDGGTPGWREGGGGPEPLTEVEFDAAHRAVHDLYGTWPCAFVEQPTRCLIRQSIRPAPPPAGVQVDREALERLRLFLRWAEQKPDGDPSRELTWGWPATLADLRAALAPLLDTPGATP